MGTNQKMYILKERGGKVVVMAQKQQLNIYKYIYKKSSAEHLHLDSQIIWWIFSNKSLI